MEGKSRNITLRSSSFPVPVVVAPSCFLKSLACINNSVACSSMPTFAVDACCVLLDAALPLLISKNRGVGGGVVDIEPGEDAATGEERLLLAPKVAILDNVSGVNVPVV